VAPSVQHRKVWLTPTAGVPCSNAEKTRNPLKLAGVPQTNETISAPSGPKFTILWWTRYCCLTNFFPIVDTCLSCADTARQICGMVPRWRLFGDFLRAVFSASRARHVSDMHSKFTLRSHHMLKYGRHQLENYRLLQERQPEIGGALSCQRMLAVLYKRSPKKGSIPERVRIIINLRWLPLGCMLPNI